MRRLTGRALYARVIANCRKLLAEYGLPMDKYRGEINGIYDLGSDMQPTLEVKFTHREDKDLTLVVTSIYPGDDGSLLQCGSNYGHLTY